MRVTGNKPEYLVLHMAPREHFTSSGCHGDGDNRQTRLLSVCHRNRVHARPGLALQSCSKTSGDEHHCIWLEEEAEYRDEEEPEWAQQGRDRNGTRA